MANGNGELPDYNDPIKQGFRHSDHNRPVVNSKDLKSGASKLYHGFNHRQDKTPYPRNTDHNGLVFFTRPLLNLSYDNLLVDRRFLPLTISDDSDSKNRKAKNSIYRAIRLMLDNRCTRSEDEGGEGIDSNLFDIKQAFMPLLSNTLIELSGFPDIALDTFTSEEGLMKETYSITDDTAEINNTFDLTANFTNIAGDPISTIFHIWALYQSNVRVGRMVPYPDMIIEREIDYQTRIWRIVLDSTKRYVKKIGCAHAAKPLASPLGAAFNYSADTLYTEDNNQISIPLRCDGAEYNDPILVIEFNQTVAMFNPPMQDPINYGMVKLNPLQINEMNFFGYPHINYKTLELEWWISQDTYNDFFK